MKNYYYSILGGRNGYLPHQTYSDKLKLVIDNPAFLKVAVLLSDVFSLAELDAPKQLLDKLNNPNFYDNKSQFLWDYMFWQVLGMSIIETEDNVLKDNRQLNYLNLAHVVVPNKTKKALDKRVFSEQTYEAQQELTIEYHEAGKKRDIQLKNLIILNDLTSTTGGLLNPLSRIDALYKIVSNSDIALDSKSRNLQFSKKFLISGRISPDNINELPMGDTEKNDIESNVTNKRKDIYPVKVPVDIQRFTDNLRNLALDESYMADYYKIGKMYSIPRDVLEAFEKGSTFENQEKARASLVSYSLQAKGNNFMTGLAKYYSLDPEQCSISWDHLPFNQVFEKEKSEVSHKNALAYKTLIDAGMKETQANQMIYETE